MTEHTYWDELAAGFALHGLSPEEEVLFADHLETCEICAASVKDHEMVAAQLGSIAHYREDDQAPSWESMRSAIVGIPQDPRIDVRDDDDTNAPVVDLSARRQRRYELSRRTLAAAAAVVIVAGGGVATWQLSSGGGSSCSASSGCHTVQLDAKGGTPAASLTIRGTTVTMDTSAMSAAPSHRVYVLWQERPDGGPTPIKEFGAAKTGMVSASLTQPYSDTSGFAVSLESAGTRPATPSNVIASGVTT